MSERYTFRRNTHTREGVYRGPFDPTIDAIGDGLYHWLDSDRGMSFDEWADAIETDDVNFYHGRYGTPTEAIEDGRSLVPLRCDLYVALVAMLEAGLVEMVPAGWRAAPPTPPRGQLTPHDQRLADAGHCMANSDGECEWSGCPQLTAERKATCPLWLASMEEDEG